MTQTEFTLATTPIGVNEKRKAYLSAYLAEYRVRNAERIKAKAAEWHQRKLSKLKSEGKSRVPSNPEAEKAYNREWKRKNKDRHLIHHWTRKGRIVTNSTPEEISSANAKIAMMKSVSHHACCYCDKSFHIDDMQFDHVVPISKGGKHSAENIDLACAICNASKSARELGAEWIPPKLRVQK